MNARLGQPVWFRPMLAMILFAHVAILGWSAHQHSPTFNELAHLPAGICHWRYQMFHLMRVNPPLPRMVAAVPVLFGTAKTDWSNYVMGPFSREDYPMGIRFAEANGPNTFRVFMLARWACIPFSVLGGYVCCKWAAAIWDARAGLLALVLWCFNPAILGNAPLVMPDVPAAALGITSCYLFWVWLTGPTWVRYAFTGVVLGAAQLSKTTLLVFFLCWPVLWLIHRWKQRAGSRTLWSLREAIMLLFMFGLAAYVINLGYGFTGSFAALKEFQFQSRVLSGQTPDQKGVAGNRFATSRLGYIPIPLPRDYVQGIDRQRADFELRDWSYLRGKWEDRGWWYYHLYALSIKTPVGTLFICGLAILLTFFRCDYSTTLAAELTLLLPAFAVIGLVSSQSGFSNHMRYTIPALPFLFVWISRVARSFELKHFTILSLAGVSTVWSVVSSLIVYPHSISYFNEFVAGPKNGHRHLLDSNVAWGQDILYLRKWLDEHPEAKPVRLATFGWIDPRLAGIEFTLPPPGPNRLVTDAHSSDSTEIGPQPGWFIVDVNFLHGTHWPAPNGDGGWSYIPPDGFNYEYFQRFEPVDLVAYSYHVYYITPEAANRVRAELGLPMLDDAADTESTRGVQP